MTIIGESATILVEYDSGFGGNHILTITDKLTGAAKCFHGEKGIAGAFRDCIRTHGIDRAIETWLRIMCRDPWLPVYKPLVLMKVKLRGRVWIGDQWSRVAWIGGTVDAATFGSIYETIDKAQTWSLIDALKIMENYGRSFRGEIFPVP